MALSSHLPLESKADSSLPSYLDPETVAESITRTESSEWSPYLFRGHYLLGPRPIRVTEHWSSTEVSPSVFLSHDATVEVTSTQTDELSAVLIGQVFDGWRPEESNQQILDRWIGQCISVEQVIHASDQLAGRWALYLRSSSEQVMIHDACGSLPIYYPVKTSELWISSSPKLIAKQIRSPLDQIVVDQIIKPYCLGSLPGIGLPCNRSPYDGVLCVLPNEALNLGDRLTHQYWPRQPLERRSIESAVEEGAMWFAGIVSAMGHRRPLLIGTTAGTDSRMMLAAAQSNSVPYRSFTWSMEGRCDYRHMDARAAQQMAHLLQNDHYLIHCPVDFSAQARAVFDASVVMSAASVERSAAKHMGHPLGEHFMLIGWGNEICRAFWRWPNWESPTIDDIVTCCGFPNSSAARSLYEPWFTRAQQVRKDANIHVLDQLYWQMRVGRWVAENFTTLNLAQPAMTPFSCRAWLSLMLEAVDGSRERSTRLYRHMVLRLEPRFAKVPYNPFPLRYRLTNSLPMFLRHSAQRVAYSLGIHGYLKKRRQKFR